MCELMPEQAHLTQYEISINDGWALLIAFPDTPLNQAYICRSFIVW